MKKGIGLWLTNLLIATVVSAIIVILFNLITGGIGTVFGVFTGILIAILSVLLLKFGSGFRPGKEEWLEAVISIILIASVLQLLSILGLELVDLKIDSIVGLATLLGAIFIGEGIAYKITKQIKL